MNNYTVLLREHNLKATPQRLAIMDIINTEGHINIDCLYKEVQKRFSSISLATIYKNINAMIDNLLLVEVKLPHKKSVFEITKENHSHLLCKECGEVQDIDIEVSDIYTNVSKENQFQIEGSELVLFGKCKKCH